MPVTEPFAVTASAGTLRAEAALAMPHRWTAEGVAVQADFTGAHLLHLAIAGCVLNDVYREAADSGIALRGVAVTAEGAFDTDDWRSTGIRYSVVVDSGAAADDVTALLDRVDAVAEIPRAVRAGAQVARTA